MRYGAFASNSLKSALALFSNGKQAHPTFSFADPLALHPFGVSEGRNHQFAASGKLSLRPLT
jgi:hypothetical protein